MEDVTAPAVNVCFAALLCLLVFDVPEEQTADCHILLDLEHLGPVLHRLQKSQLPAWLALSSPSPFVLFSLFCSAPQHLHHITSVLPH